MKKNTPFYRILAFAKPYKSYFYLNVALNLLYSVLSVISVASMFPILQMIFDPKSNKVVTNKPIYEGLSNISSFLKESFLYEIGQLVSQYGMVNTLAYFCFFTVILFLFRNLFRYLAAYCLVGLRTGTSRDIRNVMFNKILALPVAYFTDQRKGDMMARISSDVNKVESDILTSLIELFRAPIMLVVTLFALYLSSPTLTLFAFIVLPIMGIIISMISKSLKKDNRKAQTELGKLLSIVDETLNASKIIKIFNAEKHLSKIFNSSSTQWRSLTSRVIRKSDLSSPMSELLGSVTMIAIVWFGGRLILEGKGSLDGPSFLVFIGMFFQIIEPAKTLAKSIANISKGTASAERILNILDADISIHENPRPISISEFKSAINFNNVSFSYDNIQTVINNFNLKIPKGKTVALVGQSGSGKSTIANLLARFYDVTSGEILIDNHNLQDLNLEQYRNIVGMVTQDSILFNDTIFNNIALGKENATLEDVIDAAKTANAHEFIEKLPNQYYENIGEGGSKLSGGQKQRISIARAILKNPEIMILDEATSALDTQSERLVQDALDKMMKNRTSLVIAHRLSTIKNADKIIVLDGGNKIEEGTHDELIALNKNYAKLIKMQDFG